MTGKPVLPSDAAERKTVPIASGVLDYFPAALAEVAKVSYVGNKQHNGDAPLHWARGKSTDQADTIIRHFLERGTVDGDGQRHSAKMCWRALALLQLEMEAEGAPVARGASDDANFGVSIAAQRLGPEYEKNVQMRNNLDALPVGWSGGSTSWDKLTRRLAQEAEPTTAPTEVPEEDWASLYQVARNNVLAFNDLLINGKHEQAYVALTTATDCLDSLCSMADRGKIILQGKPVDFTPKVYPV